MTSDANESRNQTVKVVLGAIEPEDRSGVEDEIEQWLDFQRWLELEAPYEVVIPFRSAIAAAFKEHWKSLERRGENPKIQLRLRRDIHGMLTAIKTSAILHKAKREKDPRGAVLATFEDYENAYRAFDEGLSNLYKLRTPSTSLAVVKAIEETGATDVLASRLQSQR